MNILHVITGLNTGGAERALYNVLAGGLAVSGNSAVLSLQDEGVYGQRIRALGVPVYTLGMRRGIPTFSALSRLRQLVRSVQPRLIQGWMYHGNLAANAAAIMVSGARPAVVWNIRHSLYSLGAEKLLTRQVIRANRLFAYGAQAILYNSKLSKVQHEAFGFPKRKGCVIPNGFDIDQLRPDKDQEAAVRRVLGISSQAIVIGHVARFHPMKDHAAFLRAMVVVMRRNPKIMALLAGRSVGLDNSVLAGIVPQDLESRFHFLGERDDVAGLMQTMDALCLSSSWGEAFPNVLGEAMALGVPCVATDVGDSKDIVGETGEVVPPNDAEALARSIESLLQRSPAERENLGRAARVRIEQRYALPKVVAQYQELYERLIAEQK